MLIDTHAHITDNKYGDGGAAIAASMDADGLEAIVCVGCDVESSRAAVEAANRFSRVYAAIGVHPYYPEQVTDSFLDELRTLSRDKKAVAIGEIGLDYHYGDENRADQLRALEMQYALARELKKPIVFHVRAAAGDFIEFVRAHEFPDGGVMHCFSGSWETAEICLKKGLHIAFGGKLTYRNSKNLHEVATRMPLDRLLIETDAPYLTPAERAGEINYPKYVRYVCDKVAELRGLERAEAERITSDNARRLFGLPEYEKVV